jgi:hypothetical protein
MILTAQKLGADMKIQKARYLLFLSFFCGCLWASDNGTMPQVEFNAKYENEKYSLRIKNISESPINIGPVNFSNSAQSGFWVFIYDLKRKKIEQGYALGNPIFGGVADTQYDRKILPSGEINIVLKKDEVIGYFMKEPRCYYVVFLYRKKISGSTIFSKPSAPIFHCLK